MIVDEIATDYRFAYRRHRMLECLWSNSETCTKRENLKLSLAFWGFIPTAASNSSRKLSVLVDVVQSEAPKNLFAHKLSTCTRPRRLYMTSLEVKKSDGGGY